MKEHNTNFYSLENIKETLESCKDFLDGEEVYYHIGALRYAYEEIERLNNIIDELEKEFEWQLKKQIDIDKFAEEQGFLNYNPVKLMVEHFKNKLKELKEDR